MANAKHQPPLEMAPHAVRAHIASLRSVPGERQLTSAPHGHILTNVGVWSPDGEWIVYDTRSDPAGASFDGRTIEMVHTFTGEVRALSRSEHGACCGVATFRPRHMQAAFILGPEHPDAHWQYGPARRRGVLVDAAHPGTAIALDGRDLTPPFTPGALRGGTHVHVFSADGLWISFTYEDHILELLYAKQGRSAANPRNIGVSVAGQPVSVPRTHPRNHDGEYFSVLVTETTDRPRPGSDEISRACEEAWIGINGYMRPDGVWQRRALAFQGTVAGATGRSLVEAFVVDLPDDLTQPGKRPLEGTPEMLPVPP
ncbi:MAG TPA: DUF3748 domain-containing protein, partial [Lacipirellulaceae bacterium]|nr:DUF3748 domain-containing protein [Lacipirellulaceae bacterium]